MIKYKVTFNDKKIRNISSSNHSAIKQYILEHFDEISRIQLVKTESDEMISKVHKLLSMLIYARETSKLNHWNSTTNGEHEGYDHIHSILDEKIDTLAETFFMSRNIHIKNLLNNVSEYSEDLFEQLLAIEKLVEELCNETTTEAIKSLISGIGENIEQAIAILRITTND